MKTANILLISLGALGAFLFLRSKIKSETKNALLNALRPSALVIDNPQIRPVGSIDPPVIVLARASVVNSKVQNKILYQQDVLQNDEVLLSASNK